MLKLFLSTLILFYSMNFESAQQNRYREIYLFTASLNDASFIDQKSILNDIKGLKERDLIIHEVVKSKENERFFKKFNANFNVFTFILFGKDGGEKLRSTKPISLKKLYTTIDAMPMRQSEMQ